MECAPDSCRCGHEHEDHRHEGHDHEKAGQQSAIHSGGCCGDSAVSDDTDSSKLTGRA